MNPHVAIAPATISQISPSSRPGTEIYRKKRTRAKRSCDMCRKKKTRCDADVSQPCTKCKLANVECQFLVEQKKRGPSTGSYVEVLENRLLRMEKLLQDIAKEKQDNEEEEEEEEEDEEEGELDIDVYSPKIPREEYLEDNDSDMLQHYEEDITPNITCPTMLVHNSPADDEYDQMQEKMKILTISDYQRTRYIGASSGLHFLNEELFRTNKKHRIPEEPSWFIQKLNHDKDEHVIIKTKEIPPPAPLNSLGKEFHANRIELFKDIPHMTQELADHFIHVYFTKVHIYCPIINKTQFLEQYYFYHPSPPDKYLLYAIAAIGTVLFIPDILLVNNFQYSLDQLMDIHQILKVKSHKLLSVVYKRSMISTVQTLMLLSMFVNHDNDEEDTSHWLITGMAIRMAQDLGLHRDCSKWNIPEYEIELRKRIWYAAYLMDRWVAAELGRPISILDNEFDVELPSPFELETPPSIQTDFTPILILQAQESFIQKKPVYYCFLYLITLSQIAGQVLIGFHSTRAKQNRQENLTLLNILDRNLTNWKLSLPKELELDLNNKNDNIFNAPASVVNMACDCIWILLYRSFIKHDANQPENTNLAFKALGICTASATNLISTVEAMKHHSFVALPWNMSIYAVFQASIIFLHNAKSENEFIKEQGRKYLNKCARVYNHDPYLRKSRVVSVLQQLVKKFEVSIEDNLSSNGSNRTPSASNRRKRTGAFNTATAAVTTTITTPPVYLSEEQRLTKHTRIITDPFSANFNDMSSSRPDDMFFSSLSFGLGKNTMNAIFNLQQQQQQQDLEKRKRVQDSLDYSEYNSMTQQSQPSFTSTDNNNAFLQQSQQQFDIASLSSELPLWELPSGVTWNEWESFLKSNVN